MGSDHRSSEACRMSVCLLEMAQDDSDSQGTEELRRRAYRSIGFFSCRRILTLLRDFEDLVRHDFGFEAQHARQSLEKLVPGASVTADRERLLKNKMNRLIPLVGDVMWLSGRDTTLILEQSISVEPLRPPKKTRRRYDLLEHYFEPDHHGSFDNYRHLIQALDRAIGVFEHKKKQEFWQLFNPATYIAWVLRFPISILERVGVEGDEASSVMIKAYGWLIRLMMLLVLALVAQKLGISGVWEKLVNFIASKP